MISLKLNVASEAGNSAIIMESEFSMQKKIKIKIKIKTHRIDTAAPTSIADRVMAVADPPSL